MSEKTSGSDLKIYGLCTLAIIPLFAILGYIRERKEPKITREAIRKEWEDERGNG